MFFYDYRFDKVYSTDLKELDQESFTVSDKIRMMMFEEQTKERLSRPLSMNKELKK